MQYLKEYVKNGIKKTRFLFLFQWHFEIKDALFSFRMGNAFWEVLFKNFLSEVEFQSLVGKALE